jgi:hypothetical protein
MANTPAAPAMRKASHDVSYGLGKPRIRKRAKLVRLGRETQQFLNSSVPEKCHTGKCSNSNTCETIQDVIDDT